MEKLTIHSEIYQRRLLLFAQNDSLRGIPYIINGHEIALMWEAKATKEVARRLLLLLYDIAITENPVYRYSPKLRRMAQSLENTPLYEHDLAKLMDYICTNTGLHVDGYVTFRMDKYKETLDLMLYRMAKKWREK